jgi:hypothetical protein
VNIGPLIAMLKLFGDAGLTKPSARPPSTTGWEVLTGEGVRDVEYVVGIDPEALSAWQEEQRTREILRRL